jgi:hypothetical protein
MVDALCYPCFALLDICATPPTQQHRRATASRTGARLQTPLGAQVCVMYNYVTIQCSVSSRSASHCRCVQSLFPTPICNCSSRQILLEIQPLSVGPVSECQPSGFKIADIQRPRIFVFIVDPHHQTATK